MSEDQQNATGAAGQLNTIPKIHKLGERANRTIFSGPVVVQEKYDGSQFSFTWLPSYSKAVDVLVCRSKGKILSADPGMFKQAADKAGLLAATGALIGGAQYQCEFLAKPKHNVLTYSRTPAGFLVLFDIIGPDGKYWSDPEAVRQHALSIGLEPAQQFYCGYLTAGGGWEQDFLNCESSLGGTKVEGFVIKNYALPHAERENHPMTAKVVSAAFKERHAAACGKPSKNAGQTEIVTRIANTLLCEGRYLKAVQRLREAGKLTESAKDIGPLLAEVHRDIDEEEVDYLKEELYNAFIKEVKRQVAHAAAQWYLTKVAEGFNVFETAIAEGIEKPTNNQ
jgi:hypothetical protein